MNNFDSATFQLELERLAQAFPWDTVEIDVRRKPAGEYSFVAYVCPSDLTGAGIYKSGETITEAVDAAIQLSHTRDPKIIRERAIEDLKGKIAKLEAMTINFPPYLPNRELCERNPVLKAGAGAALRGNQTVDV